ncbi:MAG: DUF1566 domain-containing protein [Chlorobium sp.]|nr:DUF1566 domain-containing protein [Chlorobium sp.]
MGWIKNIIGSKPDDTLDRLVNLLVSYQDESVFLEALHEAMELAQKGDELGVKALSEAIRRKRGMKEVTFFVPHGGLIMRFGEELMEAEEQLLALAKSGKLLDDPAATQNLISTALRLSQDGLSGLLRKIFSLAGSEQGYDFQLLFNQMQSSINLRGARGELSSTQQITEEMSQSDTVSPSSPAIKAKIGEYYGGGIVFFLNNTGQHGLVAAKADMQGHSPDKEDGYFTWANAKDVCQNLVSNGYKDWFLPSKDQLNELYINRSAVGNFIDKFYWSSTESDASNAWRQFFGDGYQHDYSKSQGYRARAVRAF